MDQFYDFAKAFAYLKPLKATASEFDLNPVLAYPDGIMVVDARIIVQ